MNKTLRNFIEKLPLYASICISIRNDKETLNFIKIYKDEDKILINGEKIEYNKKYLNYEVIGIW